MKSRLGRRLGLARLRLRPWLLLLLRWSGGSVVFWCRGKRRLVGRAGLRFGFNVLRRRSVLFRRMGGGSLCGLGAGRLLAGSLVCRKLSACCVACCAGSFTWGVGAACAAGGLLGRGAFWVGCSSC